MPSSPSSTADSADWGFTGERYAAGATPSLPPTLEGCKGSTDREHKGHSFEGHTYIHMYVGVGVMKGYTRMTM